MTRFGSVLTAMVSPFDDQGALDLAEAGSLARWLVDGGNQGLVVAGTTGESPTLDHGEQGDLFAAVREAVSVPVVAGVGSNNTAESLDLLRRAEAARVDGVLVVTPYYNRPSQAGLVRHFRTIAEATDLPVVLYDIPVRTGRKIESDTLVELFTTVPNIVGLKDAAANPAETATVIARSPDSLEVYSGDDAMTLPLLAVGAVGVIGVATHWCAPDMVEMIEAFTKGDLEAARALNTRMLGSFEFETGLLAPNPVPTKALLRALGRPVGECRPPMGPTPGGWEAKGLAVHAALEAARRP